MSVQPDGEQAKMVASPKPKTYVPGAGLMLTLAMEGGVFWTCTTAELSVVPEALPSVGVTSQESVSPLSKELPSMLAVVTEALIPTYHW